MRVKRKSLIEESYNGIKRRNLNFIKLVQERAAKMQTSWVPFFPNDLMFKIFLLLPIKSLLRFTCVCKSWYKLIHCAEFVEAYNYIAQAVTTPILLRTTDKDCPNKFHVETQLQQYERFCFFPSNIDTKRRNFIHILEIQNDKGNIINLNISSSGSVVASCYGLILITSMYETRWRRRGSNLKNSIGPDEKPGKLIVMNPMTRKVIGFPLGTLPYASYKESYGLMFSHSSGDYKVAHLFLDKEQHIACEILSLKTRSWKAVDGPPVELIANVGRAPISAVGALHWLIGDGFDYVISMEADDEEFFFTNLPKAMGMHDRLVQMGGLLSFVNSLDTGHIEVWVLKENEWVKQHTINIDSILGHVEIEYSVPCFALNAKELVFRRRGTLYTYDFELEELKEIEIDHGRKISAYGTILPHISNLATWESLESIRHISEDEVIFIFSCITSTF